MKDLLSNLNTISTTKVPQECLDNLILCTYLGSHLNGTATEESDIDLVGIFIPLEEHVFPKDFIVGYDKPHEHKNYQNQEIMCEGKKYDVKYFSLLNFMKLIETGSPNQLEPLFAPEDKVLYQNAFGAKLRSCRETYRTSMSIPKFLGTAESHWQQYIRKGKPKQASEAIRLVIECQDFIKGNYKNPPQSTVDFYKLIKFGKYSPEELQETYNNQRLHLKNIEGDFLIKTSPLPETIDLIQSRAILDCLLGEFYGN